MNIYIPIEQLNHAHREYCLRCQKIRSFSFWQPTRETPVRLAVSKEWMRGAVTMPAFCDCFERLGKVAEEKLIAYAVILDMENDVPDGYFLDRERAARFLGDSPGEIFECEVSQSEWMHLFGQMKERA